jgi:4-diphosphocytidyl-2-C-methyl-D-erythritol kinase
MRASQHPGWLPRAPLLDGAMPLDSQRRTIAAPAKINLHLEILGRRADGYHELETVFQTITLADEVELVLAQGGGGISLRCDAPGVPTDETNLAWRAARAVQAALPGLGAIGITLIKRIPHGAGLGGGSSDAAAVLRALRSLEPAVLGLDLAAIAASIGADVPFFLLGGTAYASGVGEQLTALPDAAGGPLTILMPEAHLPTPAVYAALTEAERGPRRGEGAGAWRARMPQGWLARAENRLAAPARRLCAPLDQLLRRLEARGVPHLVCGSGAACAAFAEVAPPPGVRAYPARMRARADLDRLLGA